jgi:hypothetical protein
MAFVKGVSGNYGGRPKVVDAEKPTNRSVRQKELLYLVRKFKPLQTKAIKAAVDILDNDKASEMGKLKSAALIIQTYKDLIKETFDYRYDLEDTEEIQITDNKPVFSLRMINTEKPLED